jgi:hypothetical protein
MTTRNNIVTRATTPALAHTSLLQLCLAVSCAADDMAMQVLTGQEREVYIDARLNHLAKLELEHGKQLVETLVGGVAPGGARDEPR